MNTAIYPTRYISIISVYDIFATALHYLHLYKILLSIFTIIAII